MSLISFLLGPPIANRAAEEEKLTILSGVPAIGLDGLGSASYGPEAAMTVLAVAGTAGLGAIAPITWVIIVLLAVLTFSYWQTITAYPTNGGSYVVAHENLGRNAGLLAAAALMIDYMLNVAVGISAGVGALTSALPALHAYTLPLCLTILVAITFANLRGTRESGLAWSLPTYLFIGSLLLVLALGVWRVVQAGGHATPVLPPPPVHAASQAATAWLLLRAFAAGCTAMTGVEAVSNGVSAFRAPSVRNAHGTLLAITGVLGTLLVGIAFLARSYGIGALDQSQPGYQSVISQLVAAVSGRGALYYVAIGSVLAVLCLSANTSFVGFPRMCRLVAHDGFLPRPFAVPGRRLVYSVGVLFLFTGSAALLIGFGGITDRLIPLFAVGAFLSFTLSQAGMAAHWWRAGGQRWKLSVNGVGALASGTALAIILVAKFVEGAWLTILAIPLAVALLRAIRTHYDRIDAQLDSGSLTVNLSDRAKPVALVPVKHWNRLSRRAVEYALRLTDDVTAIHITTLEGPDADREHDDLQVRWAQMVEAPTRAAGLPTPRLVLVPSAYRSVAAPFLRGLREISLHQPGRPVVIVLPEIVESRWWGALLHSHRERLLRNSLLRFGGARVSVVTVPWQLDPVGPEQGLNHEECGDDETA